MIVNQQAMAEPAESNLTGGSDGFSKTIEFLRARLLSEREASKAARQESQEIANKLAEIQARLDLETLHRKKAEAAAEELFTVLRAKGLVLELDALLLGSKEIESPQSHKNPESPQSHKNPEKAECIDGSSERCIDSDNEAYPDRQNHSGLQERSSKKPPGDSKNMCMCVPGKPAEATSDSIAVANQHNGGLGSRTQSNQEARQGANQMQPDDLEHSGRIGSLRSILVRLTQEVNALPAEQPFRSKLHNCVDHLEKVLVGELALVADATNLAHPDFSCLAADKEECLPKNVSSGFPLVSEGIVNGATACPDEKTIISHKQQKMTNDQSFIEQPNVTKPPIEKFGILGKPHGIDSPFYPSSSLLHHGTRSSSDRQRHRNWGVSQTPAYSEACVGDYSDFRMATSLPYSYMSGLGMKMPPYELDIQRFGRGYQAMDPCMTKHWSPRISDKSIVDVASSRRNPRGQLSETLGRPTRIMMEPSCMKSTGHSYMKSTYYPGGGLMAYPFPTRDQRTVSCWRKPPKPSISDATHSLIDENGRLGSVLMALNLAKQQVTDDCGNENDYQQMVYSRHTLTGGDLNAEALRADMGQMSMNHNYNVWEVHRDDCNQAPPVHCPISPFARLDEPRMFGYEGHFQPEGEVQLGNGITLYTS